MDGTYFLIGGGLLLVVAILALIYAYGDKDSGGLIGRVRAWSTKEQAGSRQARNESLRAKLDGQTLASAHDNTSRLQSAQTEAGIAQAKAQEKGAWLDADLIAIASEQGLDVPTYLSITQKREMNDLDLEKEVRLMQEEVKNAIIVKHFGEQRIIDLLLNKYDQLTIQIQDIENSNLSESVKTQQIEIRKEYAETLLEDMRGRQKRLLESNHGGDLQGIDEEADL